MDMTSLLSQVMESRIASMMYSELSANERVVRDAPYSTRLAFDSRMRSDASQLNQSSQNMLDAANMVTAAQSGVTGIKNQMIEMFDIVQNMVVKDNLTAEEYNNYSQMLQNQIDVMTNTANGTTFNGMSLLNGTAGMKGDGTVVLQAGGLPMDQVFFNLLNTDLGTEVVGVDGSMNLSALSDKINITSVDEAIAFSDALEGYITRLGSMESDYSFDIKSLNSLSTLYQGQADTFENTIQYREEGNGSNSASSEIISSYMQELLAGSGNGSIFSGNG